MSNKRIIAKIGVERTTFSFDKLFDYLVPVGLESHAQRGVRVRIPFGRGNQNRIGVIFQTEIVSEVPKRVKDIESVLDDEPVLSDEMLKIAVWIKENTFCTYFDAVKTMIPSGMSLDIVPNFSLSGKVVSDLSEHEQNVMTFLKISKTKHEFNSIILDKTNPEQQKAIKGLIDKGILIVDEQTKKRVGDETQQVAVLSDSFLNDEINIRLTPKQKAVVVMLEEVESASFKEICYSANVTNSVINNLVKKGVLYKIEERISRSTSIDAVATESPDDIILSPHQQEVFDGISALMTGDKPSAALLKGITGSGKTSVFIKLIQKVLDSGRTAILLVPEISLTPQMLGQFQRLFGNLVAVIHSNLSMGQKSDEFERIKKGDAKIVIGTRSAIFAPLENIGIIIMDEEGEHTYKSEKTPRYHARDIAKQRCFYNNSLILMASATPSIESFYNAKRGRYKLFELTERYSNAVLPEVFMVDMKVEAELGNRSNFSEVLLHEIGKNLEKGEQTLLLLNRRGFNTHISCLSCGNIEYCPECQIPLTFHKINNTVACHYCGYKRTFDDKCSKCNSKVIKNTGTGTQRIEEEIKEFFPDARVLRMDADTTMTKNAFDEKFSAFSNGDYDIMIGTQMIAKGLDFPNVTLVGVLLIDKSLYAGDYMGFERTFSLITQVVGRSGRADKSGRAYLQTFSPDHYVLQLASRQDFDSFYEQEIAIRKAMIFPPLCSVCVIGFSAVAEGECVRAGNEFSSILIHNIKISGENFPLRVLGPAKSLISRANGRYRYRILLKCKNNRAFRIVLEKTVKEALQSKVLRNVSMFVDMNGETI